jgi:hypothetical protein
MSMAWQRDSGPASALARDDELARAEATVPSAAAAPAVTGGRPTEPQRRYLARGLTQAGGKLPLFDVDGREVPKKTIQSCVAHGWAEPWTQNPINPGWLVCRLTAAGYRALGAEPPQAHSADASALRPRG